MASSYIWTGTRFMATHHLRADTLCIDLDIARDATILLERMRYEQRTHDGLPGRNGDGDGHYEDETL